MNTNIERLSQMLKRHFHFWTEAFKDEETGEDVSIERRDILDTELSDEERQLIKAIAADIPNLTDDELHQFREEIMPFDCKTIDLIYIERVRRGDERCAQAIEDVPALLEFCDKGNRWAAYALFHKKRKLWADGSCSGKRPEVERVYPLPFTLSEISLLLNMLNNKHILQEK